MLKLLIVDDEMLIRIGMRSIIPWEEQGIEIVGEAEDGEKALELSRKYVPDIILADIRMPRMDGLTFIRTLKQEQPECKFLVLSCMDDIAYLQEAMKLGVSGYILKNAIEPQNILEEVSRIVEEIRAERVYEEQDMEEHRYVNANAVLNEFANLTLGGFIKDRKTVQERFESAFLGEEYEEVYVICIHIPPEEIKNAVKGVEYSVAAICQNMLESMGNGRTFMGSERGIWAIAGSAAGGEEDVASICRRIARTMNQCLDMHLSFGISSFHREEFDIPSHYEKAQKALNRRFYLPREEIYFYSQMNVTLDREEELKAVFERCKNQSCLQLFYQGMEELFEKLNECPFLMEKELKEGFCSAVSCMDIPGNRDKSGRELRRAVRRKIEDAPDCAKLHCVLKEWAMSQNHAPIQDSSSDDLVNTVMRYIENHIGERLTLAAIAGEVYLNPDYLCRLFKRRTGENLISYILQYKISLAKEELMEGKTISQISEYLGFSSEGHFITTFKKYCGKTPGAYIRELTK